MRIFENTQVDFLGTNKDSYLISGILLTIAIISLIYPGLEAGIDFTGGTEFIVETEQPLAPSEVREALRAPLGDGVEAKEFGDPRTLLVRTGIGGDPDSLVTSLTAALGTDFAGSNPEVLSTSSVGPRVASDLKEKAPGRSGARTGSRCGTMQTARAR